MVIWAEFWFSELGQTSCTQAAKVSDGVASRVTGAKRGNTKAQGEVAELQNTGNFLATQLGGGSFFAQ